MTLGSTIILFGACPAPPPPPSKLRPADDLEPPPARFDVNKKIFAKV